MPRDIFVHNCTTYNYKDNMTCFFGLDVVRAQDREVFPDFACEWLELFSILF